MKKLLLGIVMAGLLAVLFWPMMSMKEIRAAKDSYVPASKAKTISVIASGAIKNEGLHEIPEGSSLEYLLEVVDRIPQPLGNPKPKVVRMVDGEQMIYELDIEAIDREPLILKDGDRVILAWR